MPSNLQTALLTPLAGNDNGDGTQTLKMTGSFSAGVNVNGSVVNVGLTGTTASSAAAPTNSVGFVIEAPSTNSDAIRFTLGGTASSAAGMYMEPGRDSGFIPVATTISVCAVANTVSNAYSILWVKSS